MKRLNNSFSAISCWTTAWTDVFSPVITPVLPRYTPSLSLCKICIHYILVDYAGGRALNTVLYETFGAVTGMARVRRIKLTI